MNRSLVAVLIVCLGVPFVRAQDSRPSPASLVLGRAEMRSAAFATVYDRLVELIAERPEAYRPRTILRKLSAMRDFAVDPTKDIAALKKAVAATTIDGYVRGVYREALGLRLASIGRIAEAREAFTNDGVVRHWRVAGPFGFEGRSLHTVELAPEAEMRGAPGVHVDWRSLEIESLDVSVLPLTHVERKEGIVYLQAFICADADRDLGLMVNCRGSYKVWLNGDLVLDVDRTAARVPGLGVLPVGVGKGANVLVVKLSNGAGGADVPDIEFYARVSAVNGEPDPAVLLVNRVPDGVARAAARAPGTKSVATAAVTVPAGAEPKGLSLDERLLLAGDWSSDGLAPEAYEVISEIEDGLEDGFDPVAALTIADFLADYENIPESLRSDRAKKLYEKTLAHDPGFVPAATGLASLLARQEKGDEAARLLMKAHDADPLNRALTAALRDVFDADERGGESEFLVDRELEKPEPSLDALHAAEMRAESAHATARADALRARIAALNGNLRDPASRTIGRAIAAGDAAAVREALPKFMETVGDERSALGMRYQAEVCFWRAGEADAYDRALAVLKTIAENEPYATWPLNRSAELATEAKKPEDAVRYWKESLARDPSQNPVREILGLNRAEHEKFFAEFAIDPMATIAETKDIVKGEYAKASSVMLIDQVVTIVEEDGSVEREVHQLAAINDKNGVEQWSDPHARGEIIELRTILADGTILEPSGRESKTMPGLAPGVVVEVKYRERSWMRPGESRKIGAFFFQDSKLERGSPYWLTRGVWVLPAKTDLVFDQRHWKGGEKVEDRGARRVHVYRRDKVPALVGEIHGPEGTELVERVTLGTDDWAKPDRWAPVATEMRVAFFERSIPTPSVERAVKSAVGDAKGQTQRARAIYEWVMSEIKNPGRDANPDIVLASKSGNRTYLLAAMLRAAGVAFHPAGVNVSSDHSRTPDWRELDGGDFRAPVLYVLPDDGPALWLQSTSRFLAAGEVAGPLSDSWALVADGDGGRFVRTPPASAEWGEDSTVRLELEGDGAIAHVKFRLANAVAAPLKEQLGRLPENSRKQFVDSVVRSLFRGAKPTVKSFELENLDSRSAPLGVRAEVKLERVLKKMDDGSFTLLPPLAPAQLVLALTGGKATRKLPLVLAQATRNHMRVEIDPGEDYVVTTPPRGAVFTHDVGRYDLGWSRRGDILVGDRAIDIAAARVSPEDYADFVKFCRSVDETESARVSLQRRTQTAK